MAQLPKRVKVRIHIIFDPILMDIFGGNCKNVTVPKFRGGRAT